MSLAALQTLKDAELRRALAEYLLAIADDELILGHRHSEWTGFAPDIESDVALSSIAQEEIGHARLFYERVAELAGGDPDTLAYGRGAEQFRNAVLTEHPNGDWGYSIVRLFLYDRADAVRLETLASGSAAPLADLAKALRREEKYHLMYGEQWLRRLAGATPQSRARMQEVLGRAWPEAVAIFEPVAGQETLHTAHVVPLDAAAQLAQWQDRVVPVLESVALQVPTAVGAKVQGGGGGRGGQHSEDLGILLDEMTSVRRSEPGAKW